jgi:hypothetical protein
VRAVFSALPVSRASSCASSSACRDTAAAYANSRLLRSTGDSFAHGPFSVSPIARRAAETACCTSCASPRAIVANGSPVLGSTTSIRAPVFGATRALSM